MTRRYYVFTKSFMKCKSCIVPRLKEWLRKHLVIDTTDAEFLTREEKFCYDVTAASNIKPVELKSTSDENKN